MRSHVALPIALYLAVAPTVVVADQYDPPALVDTIVLWLSTNYGLPAPAQSPMIVRVPPAKLVEMRYGSPDAVPLGDVLAVYDDDTIYVMQGWTGTTPAELSMLVHEMVHHLQSSADMRFACPGEREVMAYSAQNAWLNLFGESLESAFGIDDATLRVSAACTY